jgi:hypothetical protein
MPLAGNGKKGHATMRVKLADEGEEDRERALFEREKDGERKERGREKDKEKDKGEGEIVASQRSVTPSLARAATGVVAGAGAPSAPASVGDPTDMEKDSGGKEAETDADGEAEQDEEFDDEFDEHEEGYDEDEPLSQTIEALDLGL